MISILINISLLIIMGVFYIIDVPVLIFAFLILLCLYNIYIVLNKDKIINYYQTQIKQNEILSEVGKMVGAVTHDIKNPLSTIKLNVEILLELIKNKNDDENNNMKSKLHLINNELNRMEELLEEFLNYARPIKLKKSKTDINSIIEDVLILYDKPNISKVQFRSELNNIPEINVDKDKIKEVLYNLISNAVEAIQNRGEILIRTYIKSKYVYITVTDTGSGIEKENLKKIFDLYFSTKSNGTGIGLFVVKKIINEHNGELNIISEVNRGTVVTIKLPV